MESWPVSILAAGVFEYSRLMETDEARALRTPTKAIKRRLLGTLTAAVFTLQACALPSYTTEEDRAGLGRIGLVSAGFDPEVDIPEPVTGKSAFVGASIGALGGMIVGGVVVLAALSSCLFAPPACPAVAPFILGGTALGGATGAAVGSESERQSEAERQALEPAIEPQLVQDALRARLFAYASKQNVGPLVVLNEPRPETLEDLFGDFPLDYRALSDDGIDAVLEVSLLEIKLERVAVLVDKYRPRAVARARLIRRADRAVLRDKIYILQGEDEPIDTWAVNKATRFQVWLDHAYGALAEYIVDDMFLIHLASSDSVLPEDYGLLPEYPELQKAQIRLFSCGTIWSSEECNFSPAHYRFTETEAIQPTFRWKPFPGKQRLDGNALKNVREVTYEIKLFTARRGRGRTSLLVPEVLGGPVYHRAGLAEPRHRIETTLSTCNNYFWTVRAQFHLKGSPRTTEWGNLAGRPWEFRQGVLLGQGYHLGAVPVGGDPTYFYFPFQTPCQSKGPSQ